MKTRNNKGFLLTLAIVALALMGTIMLVLAAGANTMLFQADTAYLQAVQRNLTSSGLAWAQVHISPDAAAGELVELNTEVFDAPNAVLTVKVAQAQADQATVRISTTCSKGRRTLNAAHDYIIDLP
ncbi:MAG: hypothetical protein JW955_16240 [Sedimentisphaerales bacterium]|nr:hypothetical protein [Sedimentisphaerales bacterium]